MLSEKDKNFILEEVSIMVENKINDYAPTKFARLSRSWFNYLTPLSIISGIWFFAQYSTEAKTLQFDTQNQKETVVNHVKNAPDPVVLDIMRRHATEAGVHMPKNMKDSIYVTRLEYLALIKNNAVDMYNMKRNSEKVLEIVEKQSKVLKAIGYQLDELKNR